MANAVKQRDIFIRIKGGENGREDGWFAKRRVITSPNNGGQSLPGRFCAGLYARQLS